jgi:hypothetical protein
MNFFHVYQASVELGLLKKSSIFASSKAPFGAFCFYSSLKTK